MAQLCPQLDLVGVAIRVEAVVREFQPPQIAVTVEPVDAQDGSSQPMRQIFYMNIMPVAIADRQDPQAEEAGSRQPNIASCQWAAISATNRQRAVAAARRYR